MLQLKLCRLTTIEWTKQKKTHTLTLRKLTCNDFSPGDDNDEKTSLIQFHVDGALRTVLPTAYHCVSDFFFFIVFVVLLTDEKLPMINVTHVIFPKYILIVEWAKKKDTVFFFLFAMEILEIFCL